MTLDLLVIVSLLAVHAWYECDVLVLAVEAARAPASLARLQPPHDHVAAPAEIGAPA